MNVAKLAKALPAFLVVLVGCVGVIPDAASPELADSAAATFPTMVETTPSTVSETTPSTVENTTMVVDEGSGRPSPTTTRPALSESASSVRYIDDFTPRIITIDESLATTVASSWRADCPVPLEALRLLQVRYWDFGEMPALGWLVVHADVADDVGRVFEELYSIGFPIERVQLVDVYGNDDDRSMEANNTSAFNCRTVGGSTSWSEHAYGRAIDINPMTNPFVTSSGNVFPPGGAKFLDRSIDVPGLITADGGVVDAFATIGWEWGGNWESSKDYQHFSKSGR